MKKTHGNYAFIDAQNINLGVKALGWKLDWRQFHSILEREYNVRRALLFVGYVFEHQEIYMFLGKMGFELVFKPVVEGAAGRHKGNVDADLVLRALTESGNYDAAVIASSDGDFYSLVDHLYTQGKLEAVLSPHSGGCSALLKNAAKDRIQFLNDRRRDLEYHS